MKFLLMSDNHTVRDTMQTIVKQLRDEVDYIFHCGDSEFAYDDAFWQSVDGYVRGNMDFDSRYPAEQVIATEVGKVWLGHGHQHMVNVYTDYIVKTAKQHGCRFAFHGHTHVLYADYRDGVLLCNPGSLNHSRGEYQGTTYALVTVEVDKVMVDFYTESMTHIPALSKQFSL